MNSFFKKNLVKWHKTVKRPLPWKGIKNPYVVWLSEIILQQTRVEQGLPYFKRFLDNYPTLEHLAKASEDEVLKHWQGLGYYSRARNMLATANYIVKKLKGEFPVTYQEIIKLKGVGPYTAAAIASFAFDEPHAVIDGNVFRVLSRYFGISTPIDTTDGKKEFIHLANEVLDKKRPAAYNQAIMDLGAVCCKPGKPLCSQCLLKEKCIAYNQNKIGAYPVKSKKIKHKIRYFNFLIIPACQSTCTAGRQNNHNNTKGKGDCPPIYIQKRKENDIWKNLYQLPLIETSQQCQDKEELIENEKMKKLFERTNYTLTSKSKLYKQTLTHQKINAHFWQVKISGNFSPKNAIFIKTNKNNLIKYAFPKIIDCYLSEQDFIGSHTPADK